MRVQPSTLRCQSSAFARYAAAVALSPLRSAISAAQTSAAISAAIVAGEYQSLVFSHRSCDVGPSLTMQPIARLTWLQVSASVCPSCQASRTGSATSSSCRSPQWARAVEVAVLREAPVRLLLVRPQVVERALRGRPVAGRDLRRGHLVEVARPHEVVGPGVARERPPDPGHRRRRDARAPVGLVLEPGQHHRRDVVEGPVSGGAARPREPAQVGVPARGVAVGGAVEAAVQRRAGGVRGRPRRGAEPERERGAPVPARPGQRQLRDLGDVALGRGGVGPVHAEVLAQVRPAVARAQVAARHARRGGLGLQRRGELRVARDQRAPVRLADVVVPAVRQRRVEQRVELVGPPVSDSKRTSTSTAARAGSVT